MIGRFVLEFIAIKLLSGSKLKLNSIFGATFPTPSTLDPMIYNFCNRFEKFESNDVANATFVTGPKHITAISSEIDIQRMNGLLPCDGFQDLPG